MAANFLQAALDLLGRPGNAVRGAVIDGPQGAMQGITGQRQYDPTELPGIRDLPDQGLSLGPLNLTPRTVAGFGAGAALDPLSYVGGVGLGHAGEGLSKGLELMDRVAPPEVAHAGEVLDKMGPGAQRLASHIPTSDSILSSVGYPGNAMSDPIEQLIDHANSITPGHEIVADSPEAAESAVAQQTGSEAGSGALRPNIPPDAETTPVGDQKYAQAKDKLGQTQAQLGELNGKAIPARQWLTETSTGTTPSSAQSWEDVVGVPRGTSVDAMRPDNTTVVKGKVRGGESDFAARGTGPDMSQGPGLTSKYNGENVGFSRQEVMSHLSNLESQIQELSHTLTGDKGSRFGDPLPQRGMDNTLSDWQAKRQLAGTPELQAQREGLMRSSTSSLPGLSPKQETLAYKKAGAQQLSQQETFRRAPDSRYYNGGEASLEDEANIPMSERGSSAPHGDPLEEARAQKESQDKFGRRSAGTYGQDDDLGHMDNQRGPGAGGAKPRYQEIQPILNDTTHEPVRDVLVNGQRIHEPTSGVTNPPRGQEAQARAADPQLEQALQMIRQMVLSRQPAPPPSSFNRFLGR